MKNILMYGAAFNPITYGHLLTAEIVMNRRSIDKVLFTPSSTKRRDKCDSLISDEHRLELLKLAVEDNDSFEVCDIELKNPGWESKTEITLRQYKDKHPDHNVYFLIGADNLQNLTKWDRGYDLVKDNKFIVVARDNYDMLKIIAEDPVLRKFEYNFDLIHKGTKMDISSTMARDNISIGKSARYLLPPQCIDYINKHNLYK